MLVAACPIGAQCHTALRQHSSYGASWQGYGRAACMGGDRDWHNGDRAVVCPVLVAEAWSWWVFCPLSTACASGDDAVEEFLVPPAQLSVA